MSAENLPLVPGESGRVVGIGFTSNTIVHIGETSVPAEGDTRYPQFAQRFIVPASLHPGSYLVYVSDELGKSNEVAVIVVDAKVEAALNAVDWRNGHGTLCRSAKGCGTPKT